MQIDKDHAILGSFRNVTDNIHTERTWNDRISATENHSQQECQISDPNVRHNEYNLICYFLQNHENDFLLDNAEFFKIKVDTLHLLKHKAIFISSDRKFHLFLSLSKAEYRSRARLSRH
jgi:hypothetical protein